MEYFLLCQKVTNPISISGLEETLYKNNLSHEKFCELPSVLAAYVDSGSDQEIPDLVTRPMFMVSDRTKDLISLYEPMIEWRGVQVLPQSPELVSQASSSLYWAGDYPVQNCIHHESEFYPDGRINKLVLDKRMIRNQAIFRVGGLLECRIVISLRLAESILRRNLYGVGLAEIKIQ